MVFTTRPDTLSGATFCVIAPEHPLLETLATNPDVAAYVAVAKNRSDMDRTAEKEKTGVFTGSYAVNPLTGAQVPIWVADYVLISYGTGAIMAVPGHDDRDYAFARKFDLPIVRVVEGGELPFTGEGIACNSGVLDGLRTAEAKQRAITLVEEKSVGVRKVTYKLRDWLFSRQRYWGEPFPMVHLANGTVVPSEDLPLLPALDDFRPTQDGEPPLARAKDWLHTTWKGQPARRETNTMPQWAGSCWYYLRYMDPHNTLAPFSPEQERKWSPVDLYIGGVEHVVFYLFYLPILQSDRFLFSCFATVGTRDPLIDDTQRLEAALRARGVRHEARYYPGEMHAFHALIWRDNAKRCWRDTFRFLDDVMP